MSSDTFENEWTIIVVTENEKKRRVNVKENCTVKELIERVATTLGQNKNQVLLVYANTPTALSLETEEIYNKRLSEYSIEDNSVLTLVLRMMGGVWITWALRDRKRTLESLDGFITVTTDPSEPDMISFDDSPENKRAKMPCGHVIGPESMTSYCKSLLSEGKFIFRCPHIDDYSGECCNREWPFFLVRHVACLTTQELQDIEKKIAENVLKRAVGIQQCPGCNNWCFRDNPSNNCVICSICTKNKMKKGYLFQFCWQCLGIWQGRKTCENNDCKDMDRRIQILAKCPEKLIEQTVMAPSVRGCPRCGVLIEHKDQCKHMTCSCCTYSFCFFCLKEMKNGSWQCQAYRGDCTVAPRQTWLPSIKDVKFTELYPAEMSSSTIS